VTESAPPLPDHEPAPKGRGARFATIVVAFGVFALAAGVFVVPALWMRSSEGPGAAPSGATSYPPVPLTGYYVVFPSVPDGGRVIAITNLPEGTLYAVSSGNAGSDGFDSFSCCPAVHDGYMGAEGFNDTCNSPVGAIGNSSGFDVTIEIQPDFSSVMGGFPRPPGASLGPTSQPDNVLAVLGNRFENLTGDQVTDLPNGGKELVATASYAWPEPQCGGKTYPLWGDPNCSQGTNPGIDGPELKDAMQEVVGALSQARMCEFWLTMLTNDGRAKHPWTPFSDEWLAWYQDGPKDFSDGDPPRSTLTWRTSATEGESTIVDVLASGTPVLELRMTNLLDCSYCNASTTPPWHVASWTFVA